MPLKLNGSTSGYVTIDAPAIAGTTALTLPSANGTLISSGSSAALPVSAINATGTPSASTYLRGDGAWAGVSATGQLIRAPQLLTSGTSYTTPANCNNVFIEMIGAGGGGGGSNNVNSGSAGGGGGAAPYASVYVSVTPSTTYTYAVGSGGSGGSQANGTSGGTTSITIGATTYSISGGGGGTYVNNGNGSAGSSGAATNFSFTLTSFLQAATVPGGGSCATPYGLNVGGNALFSNSNSASVPGYGWGAGGGGGNSSSAGARAGGAGYQGMIRIWEYT
jgi:hypothetical protein